MSVKYIIVYDDDELDQIKVERFPSLEKLTEFINNEKLLPQAIEAYEISKEVKFKIVSTFEAKPTEGKK